MAKEVITIVGRDNATPAFQSAAGAATEAAAKINTAVNSVKNISNSLEKAGINAKSFSEKITFAADLSMALSGVKKAAEIAASALARPLQEFSRFEDAATRMAPLVGGLSTAKSLCEELRDEAANGTMSFEQLASVAGRLSSVFNDTASVRKWTTAFHNLAAGTLSCAEVEKAILAISTGTFFSKHSCTAATLR
ncbi:MAG: hypothetical protein IJW12_01945 [Opitutales bacterium]|nr:hypothetical protein [Opitutales bacterium]